MGDRDDWIGEITELPFSKGGSVIFVLRKGCKLKQLLRTSLLFLFIPFLTCPSYAEEPFDFVDSLIRSLSTCYIAESHLKTKNNDTSNEVDSLMITMKDLFVFNKELESARLPIQPYIESKNEIMKTVSQTYDVIYLSAMMNNKKIISLIEQMMNSKEQISQQGTFSKNFIEIMAENEDSWRQLVKVTAFSTYSLVDRNRLIDGKMAYLRINSKERKMLIKNIENSFGDEVKGGIKTGQFPIVASASLLWGFLHKDWKSSDEK